MAEVCARIVTRTHFEQRSYGAKVDVPESIYLQLRHLRCLPNQQRDTSQLAPHKTPMASSLPLNETIASTCKHIYSLKSETRTRIKYIKEQVPIYKSEKLQVKLLLKKVNVCLF